MFFLFRLNFSPTADFDGNGNLTDYSLTADEWGRFLIDIFDAWLEKDDVRVKIQLLDSFLQGLIGGGPGICVCQKDCTNFVSVDHDGSVFFCGRFLGDPEFKLGQITQQSLLDILNGQRIKEISHEISYMKPECLSCEWRNICNGGCPSHYYSASNKFKNPYYFCKSMKMILSHMNLFLSQYPNINTTPAIKCEGEYQM